jgi:hypothetical protein
MSDESSGEEDLDPELALSISRAKEAIAERAIASASAARLDDARQADARVAHARRQLAMEEAHAARLVLADAAADTAATKQVHVEREAASLATERQLRKERLEAAAVRAEGTGAAAVVAAPSLEMVVQKMQEQMAAQMATQMQALTELAAAVRLGNASSPPNVASATAAEAAATAATAAAAAAAAAATRTATVGTPLSSTVFTPPPLGLQQQPPVSSEKVAEPRRLFAPGAPSLPETDLAEQAAKTAALMPSKPLKVNSLSHKKEYMSLSRRFEVDDESIGPGMRALFSGTRKDWCFCHWLSCMLPDPCGVELLHKLILRALHDHVIFHHENGHMFVELSVSNWFCCCLVVLFGSLIVSIWPLLLKFGFWFYNLLGFWSCAILEERNQLLRSFVLNDCNVAATEAGVTQTRTQLTRSEHEKVKANVRTMRDVFHFSELLA